jgi:hypothetical protein
MHMKVLVETFTTKGHSEGERILLNCVLVQCFNDTIRSSKSGGLAVVNLWIPSNSVLYLPLSPHVIRDVTHNTILEGGLPLLKKLYRRHETSEKNWLSK